MAMGAVVAVLAINSGSPEGRPSAESVATPGSSTPASSPLLRPNMRSLQPFDLRIDDTGAIRVLRFSAALANLGPGPMLLNPSPDVECPGDQRGAAQVLQIDSDDDGEFQRDQDRDTVRREAGCMLDHPTHDHWHFDAMAGYALRMPGDAELVVSRDKVSFCLRDNEQVPGQRVVVEREYFGDCRRDGPQGVSPGWSDIYQYDLDGQSLRLPDSVEGEVVCLDLAADPFDLLEETNENDNAASLAVTVTGDDVRTASNQAVCSPA